MVFLKYSLANEQVAAQGWRTYAEEASKTLKLDGERAERREKRDDFATS